jgi:predicted transcriptional regulator
MRKREGTVPKKTRSPKSGMAHTERAPAKIPAAVHGNLAKILSLIKANPGIRPSEINRVLRFEQSDSLRNTLLRRGLIRKEKQGSAVRYYPL